MTDSTATTTKISYTPATVSVSRPDGDEQVDGHNVVVTFPGGRTVTGTRIEPEGPSRDCWLGGELAGLADTIIEALRDMATEVDVLDDLVLSEVLALLPEGIDWRIFSSTEARGRLADGRSWLIYWDEQGWPANGVGWAYQIAGDDDHSHESGALDTSDDLSNVFC